jgi:hypothetical protein
MKLQRDQVVAATLVGTVVVVLGFASGIGRVPQTQNVVSQPDQHSHAPTTTSPAEQPPQPENPMPQPVAYDPAPMPPVPEGPHVPAPEHSHPDVPPPTTPPTTTPTTPPTSEPGKPCDAGAITKLLRQLGLLSLLGDDLPLVHELPTGTKKAGELKQPSLVDLPLLGDPVELLGDAGKLVGDLLGSTCALAVDEKTGQVKAVLDTP